MCVTMLGQIVYMAIMFTGLVITLVSMFTPSWRVFEESCDNKKDCNFGLLICSDDAFPSSTPSSGSLTTTSANLGTKCEEWWRWRETWEKAVIVGMALAVITQVVALIWTGVTFCACCCKRYLTHPLPLLAALAAIFLLIAIAIFAAKNKDDLEWKHTVKWQKEPVIGYSFWLACGATACMIVSSILGCLVVRIAKTPF